MSDIRLIQDEPKLAVTMSVSEWQRVCVRAREMAQECSDWMVVNILTGDVEAALKDG